MKVIEIQFVVNGEDFDDYGYRINPGVCFIKGSFLERCCDSKTSQEYHLSKKLSLFYSISAVYSYIVFKKTKKGFVLKRCSIF